jgi:hypothetical protein
MSTLLEQEALPATVFIPEKYLTHKEVITNLLGFGWGITLPAAELGQAIRSGRVHYSVLPNNFIAVIHETAIDPNL